MALASDGGAFRAAGKNHLFANYFVARPEAPSRPAYRPVASCAEIDCVRARFAPSIISAVESRARELNIGADQVLISSGLISEDFFCRAFAFTLGLPFVRLAGYRRTACPLSDDELLQVAQTDVLPLRDEDEIVHIIAPRGLRARSLVALLGRAHFKARIRITTPAAMRAFVAHHCGERIAHDAAEGLVAAKPELSSASLGRQYRGGVPRIGFSIALGILLAPHATILLLQSLLTAAFLGATALRLLGASRSAPLPAITRLTGDASLPHYTIVAALYDEVEALPGLMRSLTAFDYPAEKVEIKVILEIDDAWTRLAAEFLQAQFRFEIVLAPPGGPRTKPKALNCALPFARGDLIVVYDAEDRPEPDQLRQAAEAFACGNASLACVQARLTIDNSQDSWLTRLFTAEYAGLFDVLLPGLAALRLPLPLGGSSNHFRTEVLREVGAWDAYNVTEDADLGMRLARAGYQSNTIHSTTFEEAPSRLRPWVKQRTRWFKGWLQTLIVHMREPRRLVAEIGLSGAAAFYLVVGGTVLSALVQPIALLWLALAWCAGVPFLPEASTSPAALLCWIHVAALFSGYLSSAVLAWMGLRRRGLLGIAWIFVALPVLWGLLSYTAWRALIQFYRCPQLWEKTQHGRARTSRLDEALRHSPAKDNAADPPRSPRAFA